MKILLVLQWMLYLFLTNIKEISWMLKTYMMIHPRLDLWLITMFQQNTKRWLSRQKKELSMQLSSKKRRKSINYNLFLKLLHLLLLFMISTKMAIYKNLSALNYARMSFNSLINKTNLMKWHLTVYSIS